jgi:hypothetical protein
MARGGVFLVALLLLVPSANYHYFDGLPLSGWPELLGLVLLMPLLVSPVLRRLYARRARRWPHSLRVGVLGAACVALTLKVLLLASGTHAGFPACYRSPLEPPRSGPCQRSFENPFFRFSVTRIDHGISFGERDWDLGFLNDVRFRFYPRPTYRGPLRWRIPIAVTWQGLIERAEPWVARVT